MKLFRFSAILACVSFVLHFVWESFHVSLYGGYEHLSPVLPITVFASAGDVLYTFGAFVLFSFFKRSLNWPINFRVRDGAILACLGVYIAVFVEYKALVFGRWYYLPAMPIIPFLEVGLSPILQMTLLLPLSFWLAGALEKYFFGKALRQ